MGLAAGRLYRPERPGRWMALFCALSLLPDADVIAFVFRIPYAAPFGHRGATHSLAFAALTAVLGLLVSRDRRLAGFIGLVVVSHPLLDMLTDGGLGCALFFPFWNERLFWPVQPIPVAPIGAGMVSARGLTVVLVEALLFSPLLLFAVLRRRTRP